MDLQKLIWRNTRGRWRTKIYLAIAEPIVAQERQLMPVRPWQRSFDIKDFGDMVQTALESRNKQWLPWELKA